MDRMGQLDLFVADKKMADRRDVVNRSLEHAIREQKEINTFVEQHRKEVTSEKNKNHVDELLSSELVQDEGKSKYETEKDRIDSFVMRSVRLETIIGSDTSNK